jgi:hypothetical protein
LKLNNGRRIVQHWAKLVQLFVSLELPKRSQYTRALFMQMTLWRYHKSHRTRTWKLFCKNPHMWNEDIGETCFGVLARAISAQPNHSKIGWVNEQFMMIKPLIAAVGDLNMDLGDHEKRSGALPKGKRFDVGCDEVTSTQMFMKRIIRSVATGRATIYSDDSFDTSALGIANCIKLADKPGWHRKLLMKYDTVLRSFIEKFKTQMVSFWCEQNITMTQVLSNTFGDDVGEVDVGSGADMSGSNDDDVASVSYDDDDMERMISDPEHGSEMKNDDRADDIGKALSDEERSFDEVEEPHFELDSDPNVNDNVSDAAEVVRHGIQRPKKKKRKISSAPPGQVDQVPRAGGRTRKPRGWYEDC